MSVTTLNNLKDKFSNSNEMHKNYKRMWPYIKPYLVRAIIAVLLCIPIGSLDAIIALSLKPYMDIVLVQKTAQSPMYIPFIIVAFTSLQGILNYSATYLNTWVGLKITNALKHDLYKKLLSMETSFFDKSTSGTIIYRFNNDADMASAGLLNNLKMFVMRLCSSLSLIGVLLYNSWQLAIIAIVVLGCAFLPLAKVKKTIKNLMDQTVFAGSDIMTTYNETFGGNKTIAAYNLGEYQERKYKQTLETVFSLAIKMTQRTGWLSPMMHIIVSIGIGLVIGLGSYLIVNKTITSGNFVSFITALIMLYTPVKTMGGNYVAVQQSFIAIDRVFDVMETESQIKDKENAVELQAIKNTISFEDVCFEYVENTPVLKGINLEAKAGETVALVGNSGGGKSTIVNLLPRFYDIKSGSIKIDGVDIRDLTLKSLRDKIAVVFQDNFLFSGTIRENILLGHPEASDIEIHNALKNAYLDEFVSSLEKGIDTQIGERGILLSGGQKQRVAIARAFIKNAPIVILDEATSALDNKSEAVVQKAIDNLMANRTVFVIAHRLSTVQNATKIAVINEGDIVEIGNHEELLNVENGAYKSLYMAQFKGKEASIA